MIDFEKLDRLFEVTYNKNKACMFAYVWAKKEESDELESKKHIKLSDAFNKAKDHKWHFYPGDENNLTTYLVTGILNKELGAFETDDVTLFLFSLGNKAPFSDIDDTNGILDTTTKEINSARHNVNFMLGFWTEFNLIKGVDYKDEKDLKSLCNVLNSNKSKAINLLQKAFPEKFEMLKNNFMNLI